MKQNIIHLILFEFKKFEYKKQIIIFSMILTILISLDLIIFIEFLLL